MDNLFYVVFFLQVLLLSWALPARVASRMAWVLNNYPQAQYPRLYQRSPDIYQFGRRVFIAANAVVLMLGIGLLFALMLWVDHSTFADDGEISEFWPIAFAGVQMLPMITLEILGMNQLRMMRSAADVNQRRADLSRSGFIDSVSPVWLAVAVIMFAFALVADLFANGGALEWDKAITLLAGNVFMVLLTRWTVFRRKLDPHQAPTDLIRARKATASMIVFTSIAMSSFFIMTAVDQAFGLDYLDAIIMSIYVQSLGLLIMFSLLKRLNVHELDFEVYRDTPPTTT